jgi:hypothetical protein
MFSTRIETCSSHIGVADCFDLLNAAELILIQKLRERDKRDDSLIKTNFIEFGNDLIE